MAPKGLYGILANFILRHYTNTKLVRSKEQLEKEKYLGPIKFNRYFMLPAIVLLQFCSGSMYAFSGYNIPIETAIYGPNIGPKGVLVDRNIASITFYITICMTGLSAAYCGPWIERNGPKKVALVGAVLFFIGEMLTCLGIVVKQIALVYVGFGIFTGFAIGLLYLSPVSAVQKWFPDMRGFSGGLAVCGFGGGSIAASFAQKELILRFGVAKCFLITGMYYFGIMILCSLILRFPPDDYTVNGVGLETIQGTQDTVKVIHTARGNMEDNPSRELVSAEKGDKANSVDTTSLKAFRMNLAEAILSFEYRVMYITFFGSALGGLLFASKIQSIATNQFGRTLDEAAQANAIMGSCNTLGRLIIPTITDAIGGRKNMYIFIVLVQVVLISSYSTLIHDRNYEVFLFVFAVTIFLYGGGFGLIPAFVSDQFGAKNHSGTHGVALTILSVISVCGVLIYTNVLNTQLDYYKRINPKNYLRYIYDVNFIWIEVTMAFTLLVNIFLLSTDARVRFIPRVNGEICRFRNPLNQYNLTIWYWNTHLKELDTVEDEDNTKIDIGKARLARIVTEYVREKGTPSCCFHVRVLSHDEEEKIWIQHVEGMQRLREEEDLAKKGLDVTKVYA